MSGFLVEVTPGHEQLYSTTWAFRAAMRSGEITSDSRILHRTSSRWIPITAHPEYRRFLAQRDPPLWMQPIPLEPANPAPRPAAPGSARLAGLRHTIASTWAALRRRLETRSARSREVAPTLPSPPPQHLPPPRNRWTFLP